MYTMRSSIFKAVIILPFATLACRDSGSAGKNALDSAGAVAVAVRLAGPDRPPGFGVLGFVRDTGGYVVDLGPPLVTLGPSGETTGVIVGGRVTVRVRPNGQGTVLFRSQ